MTWKGPRPRKSKTAKKSGWKTKPAGRVKER